MHALHCGQPASAVKELPAHAAPRHTLFKTVEGTWALDSGSQPLTSFLRACGVPFLVAPLLGKAFDSDHMLISVKGGYFTVSLSRNGWSLPIKLQTDATYSLAGKTVIRTPRGEQVGRLLQPHPGWTPRELHIERVGPDEGEHVEEHYVVAGDEKLEATLRHVRGSAVTEVRRTFKRI